MERGLDMSNPSLKEILGNDNTQEPVLSLGEILLLTAKAMGLTPVRLEQDTQALLPTHLWIQKPRTEGEFVWEPHRNEKQLLLLITRFHIDLQWHHERSKAGGFMCRARLHDQPWSNIWYHFPYAAVCNAVALWYKGRT